MEHLNQMAKEAIKGLGANKTEKAILRVGHALGTIVPVLHNFGALGRHKLAKVTKDIEIIISVLTSQSIRLKKALDGITIPSKKYGMYYRLQIRSKHWIG